MSTLPLLFMMHAKVTAGPYAQVFNMGGYNQPRDKSNDEHVKIHVR